MARPVQIDRSKALRAARDIFWRQGFTTTSMSQLLKAMDIGSGSFYAAYGSKPVAVNFAISSSFVSVGIFNLRARKLRLIPSNIPSNV